MEGVEVLVSPVKLLIYFLVVLQKSWLQCKELNGKKMV